MESAKPIQFYPLILAQNGAKNTERKEYNFLQKHHRKSPVSAPWDEFLNRDSWFKTWVTLCYDKALHNFIPLQLSAPSSLNGTRANRAGPGPHETAKFELTKQGKNFVMVS